VHPHDYDEVDINRTNGANPGVENVVVHVGEQAEELALTQEADSRNSHTGAAMDQAAARDLDTTSTSDPMPQTRPESSSDHVPTDSSESTSRFAPIPPERGVHSPAVDTHQSLEDYRVVGNAKAAGSIVPRGAITREAAAEENLVESRDQIALAVNRPRTRLQDNIVKPKNLL
jgi:hypothetical protein